MKNISTTLIHAGDDISRVSDVAPPINIATTYEYDKDPEKLVKASENQDLFGSFVYSREFHPNSVQVEKAIGDMTGSHVIAYNSGLSSFFAAMTYFNPKIVCVGKGYHGVHGIINILSENYGIKKISLDDNLSQLNKGDVIHLETPVNPEGLNFNIKHFACKAHERGAFLIVDSTLAPPPIQDPFEFGADMVMHSASKYFGGHSDLLAGLLLTKDKKVKEKLLHQRIDLGTNIANLESALLVRSLRTYELRIKKQVENVLKIVDHLQNNKSKYPKLKEIIHGSLQTDEYIKEQLSGGQSPVFAVKLDTERNARYFPSKLKYFIHATSLGGCESLVEWRALSDSEIDPTLIRISVGVENVDDLINDLDQALQE